MSCQWLINKYGEGHRYVKDCQVRAVRGKSFSEAAALLGWTDPPPIVIRAGIGTLVIGTEHQDFTPAPTTGQMAKSWLKSLADRTAASPETVATRQALCDTCEWMDPQRRTCAVCGCGTAAKTALAAQRCPKGRW